MMSTASQNLAVPAKQAAGTSRANLLRILNYAAIGFAVVVIGLAILPL